MIKIKNIYYMLSYAFSILQEDEYKSIELEEFDNISNLFSSILYKGTKSLIKKGLNKEYVQTKDELSTVKGKIELNETIKKQSILKRKIICSFDEMNYDFYLNRILKTTLYYLLKSNASRQHKNNLKKVYLYFEDINIIPIKEINWKIVYTKHTAFYKMLISICRLVVDGLIFSTTEGTYKVRNFIDDQKMHRLYEKFILEFYKKELPEYRANSSKIEWAADNGFKDKLPEMKTDIMLSNKNKIFIIDAKYYSSTFQNNYGKELLRSSHIYQIFSYVKNKQTEDLSKEVAGLLLYAKTDNEDFNSLNYIISGNRIGADYLDLNQDFSLIKDKLITIASNFLK